MKMINGGTQSDYTAISRNCNLGGCRRVFYAPVPSLSDVQLYINFGIVKPASIAFTIFDLCTPFQNETVTSDCFIIANNGTYWYGIYKNFTGSSYPTYLIKAAVTYVDSTVQYFYSEQYQNATSCDTLTKVSVCYPANYNAEDVNGIYVGAPDLTQAISGKASIYYQHTYWLNGSEIIETSNKITFTANLYKSFNTDLKKLYEFRNTTLVPGWYKDYLLAVYFRGQININNTPALISDLNFENTNEGADLWKAYAVLGKEIKGAFGCADIVCPVDCICVPVSLPSIVFAGATIGIPYTKTVTVSGTDPFTISSIVKPSWMAIVITGSVITFSGTPDTTGTQDISFVITNECGSDNLSGGSIVVSAFVPSPFAVVLFRTGPAAAGNLVASITGGTGPYTYHFACTPIGLCGTYNIPVPDGTTDGGDPVITAYTATLYVAVTYNFICTVTDSLGAHATSNIVVNPACLVPGTLIKMADGSHKQLNSLAVDDELFSTEINKIESFLRVKVDRIYNINKGLLETSEGHVNILEDGTLLQSVDLKIGDTLDGGTIIETIDVVYGEFEVINIATTNKTYYANGILTHNKFACP